MTASYSIYRVPSVPIGNQEYNNRKTLDEAIQRGKCLYSISGDNSYPMHDFYRSVLSIHLCSTRCCEYSTSCGNMGLTSWKGCVTDWFHKMCVSGMAVICSGQLLSHSNCGTELRAYIYSFVYKSQWGCNSRQPSNACNSFNVPPYLHRHTQCTTNLSLLHVLPPWLLGSYLFA